MAPEFRRSLPSWQPASGLLIAQVTRESGTFQTFRGAPFSVLDGLHCKAVKYKVPFLTWPILEVSGTCASHNAIQQDGAT